MRTVSFIVLFHDGTFRRVLLEVPNTHKAWDFIADEAEGDDDLPWGDPDYAGFLIEYDPLSPPQWASTCYHNEQGVPEYGED